MDNFEQYRKNAKQAGLSDNEIETEINRMKDEDKCLGMGMCPSCRKTGILTKKLDFRQAGYRSVGTVWYNYRCGCGFMTDRAEESAPTHLLN